MPLSCGGRSTANGGGREEEEEEVEEEEEESLCSFGFFLVLFFGFFPVSESHSRPGGDVCEQG